MDAQNGRLAERYQELAADFHSRWLTTWKKLAVCSAIGGTMPVFGYLVQEQLVNPVSKVAVAAGAMAITGASLRSAYLSVDYEGLLHTEYRHFKDLSLAQAGEPARPE